MRRIQKTYDVFLAIVCAFLSHRLDVNIHTSSFTLFVLRTQGKLETGKAIGFKEEENNSMISLPLTREYFLKDMGSNMAIRVKAFMTTGD